MRWSVTQLSLLLLVCWVTICAGFLDEETEFFQNDFYGALELKNHDVSTKEIKKAYRKLSMENHPDRIGGKESQRFVDVARAYEVLSKAESRARYDSFIYNLPRAFRPVYGKERPAFRVSRSNPVVVTIGGFVFFVVGISLLQNSQFKRERERAFRSDFYTESLQIAIDKGKTKEEFDRMFLLANPELTRTFSDTLLVKLVHLPVRMFQKAPEPDPSSFQEEEEVEETEEEREERERKEQEEIRKKNEQIRAEQKANREEARKRKQKKEKLRKMKFQIEERARRIETKLNMDIVKRITERSKPFRAYLVQADMMNPKTGEIENSLGALKDIFQSMLDGEADDDFWPDVFDTTFDEYFEEKQREQEEELERQEEEKRNALQNLYDEDDGKGQGGGDDEENDAAEQDDDDKTGEIDEEWQKELAAMEAEKQAKKEKAKEAKKKIAEENKAKNEQRKKSQQQNKGKKERRR